MFHFLCSMMHLHARKPFQIAMVIGLAASFCACGASQGRNFSDSDGDIDSGPDGDSELQSDGDMIANCLEEREPPVQWAKSVGSNFDDRGDCVAILDDGSSFVAGWVDRDAIFARGEEEETILPARSSAFVARYGSDGKLRWVRGASGSMTSHASDVAATEDCGVVVVGNFFGEAEFSTGEEDRLISSGESDVFVARYDADGELLWARRAGGESEDQVNGVAISPDGSVYVTGSSSEGASFGLGEPRETSFDESGIFVARFESTGSLIWVRQARGPSASGNDIIIDDGGDVLIVGQAFYGDTLFGEGEPNETNLRIINRTAFVSSFGSDGSFRWVLPFNSGAQTFGLNITNGNDGPIVLGYFSGTLIAGGSTLEAGARDLFLIQLDRDGNILWARQIHGPNSGGGSSSMTACGVGVTPDGEIILGGGTPATATFGIGEATEITLSEPEVFVARYGPDGDFRAVTAIGGAYRVEGCASFPEGGMLMTGHYYTSSTWFTDQEDETELTALGPWDAFIIRTFRPE